MKITVIADKNGHILGTYRHPTQVPEGYPTFHIHGGAEHMVHELSHRLKTLTRRSDRGLH